jgi:hypothetical protein
MSGAYPGPGSFMISARGTNLPDLIAKGETPRDARELLAQIDAGELTVKNLEIWKTDCPELALKDHDLYVDAAGSSGGWGDPLDRDPLLVIRDLDDGMTPDYAFVHRMFGVVATQSADGSWQLDAAATDAKRRELRAARLAESQDPADWWATERKQVLAQDFVPEVREMYAQSLSFAKFDREFRDFWQVPESFKFSAE